MIIEFFGLSKTGKTNFKNKIVSSEYLILNQESLSPFKKIILFSKYLIKRPINTFYIFYKLNTNNLSKKFKVIKMRNTYLITVLAKYELIKNLQKKILLDEFFLQSLFMIFQKKSTKSEIKKILTSFPNSDFILLFERSKKERYEIYEKPHTSFNNPTMYPGGWIDINYAKKWMEIMEHNYEIIKEIILENYVESTLKDSTLKIPKNVKVYSKK